MRKAIYIEQSDLPIKRVLAIAPPEAAPELDGRKYFVIEDYHEPEVQNAMTKAYPIYNDETKAFGYIYEDWQATINQQILDIENLKNQAAALLQDLEKQKAASAQAIVELTQLILTAGGGAADVPPMPPTE